MVAANVPLSDTQTKGIIAVSTVRSAQIIDVNNIIVEPFPQTVPTSIDETAFENSLLYIASLKKRQAILLSLAGKMQTLIAVEENNTILDVNLIMNNARLLAGGDKNIKEGVEKITVKYFTKKAAKVATGYEIKEAGVMTISKVVTEKKLTNKRATVLTFLQVGASIGLTITVNPFTAVGVPKGWTNIVVTNLSQTDPGGFELFVK